MSKPAVQVEGMDELRKGLRHINDVGLNQAYKDANKEIADEIVQRALPNVPVLTGKLKASVKAFGNLSGALGKAGNAAVPYAAAIHWGRKFGNVGSPPGNHEGANPILGRPFLRDAAEAVEPQVADRYLNHIDRVFDEVRARGNL